MRTYRIFYSLICLLLMLPAFAHADDRRLEEFNHSVRFDGVSADELDRTWISEFKKGDFVCRNAVDYTPQETAPAQREFAEFVRFVKLGGADENFWTNPANRKKREDLMASAVKAGSWKGAYVDSVWSIRFPKPGQSPQEVSRQLEELVRQGIPISAYKYATYLYGRDDDTMHYLMKAAIDRGSPNAMEWVGGSIVVRSKQLRPLAKSMLACAAAQGNANAYADLGRLADMEGRKVDAFRLWVKGVNSGCDRCVENLARFAKIRTGYDPATTSLMDLMPELKQIDHFYSESFMYEDTELPDLFRPLPVALEFHPTDEDILKLLEFEASKSTE